MKQEDTSQRRVLGIKAKLLLAFCSLAGLTAIASTVAWFVFVRIDASVTRVTAESLPGMVGALNLAEKSAEIAATAPAIMASNSEAERALEQTKLEEKTQDLAVLIENLDALSTDRTIELSEIAELFAARLVDLNVAVEKRLRLKEQREAGVIALSKVHANFLETLEPLIDDAVFDLVVSSEDVTAESSTAITGLVEDGLSTIDRLLTINAEGNLAAGLLAEATHVGDPVLLQPIRERFLSAAATIERNLHQMPDSPDKTVLRQVTATLLDLGVGAGNIFEVRERDLRVATAGDASLKANQSELTAALKVKHEALLLTLAPMIDDATFDLVLSTEGVTGRSTDAITELIDVGANALTLLLTLRAEANLAAGLLNEAAGIPDPNLLQPLRERFVAAKARIEGLLAQLPATLEDGALRNGAVALVDFGKSEDGIFALRREELGEISVAQSSLEGSRALAVQLGDEVAERVMAARTESDAAASRSAEAIESGKLFMLVITLASIAGAAIVMLNYVGPRIIRPLEAITRAMTELAAGDTSVDIPGRERGDEVGRMARALGVFRDTAVEVQRSNLREIEETRRRLTDAIESISEGFSLYDNEDRLVVCNNEYRRILYPDTADEIVPGMTFESIVRRAAETGQIRDAEGRIEEWVTERLARHREPGPPHVQQRSDGRYIMVSERRTDDGGTVAVYSDITELKQRETELAQKSKALEHLSSQLAKYLSPQVYESIFTGRQEVKVASHRKKLTVFFSDIAGFTEAADKMASEDLTQLLNHYLSEMSQIALDHGATIDKYVGDAILIFFGDPETKGVKEDALACVEMAIAMRQRMQELQEIWRDSGIENPLKCRMGINTGYCTVGNFGSEARMDYTIIGSGVNLASRLESATEPGEILISFDTYAQIKDRVHCQERGSITVKGIAYPVAIYQVVDTFEQLETERHIVHEKQPNLKLDMDAEAMSAEERSKAEIALSRALDRLSAVDRGAKPRRRTK